MKSSKAVQWRQLVWHIFYMGIFLLPLLYNPWGGANPYEITKQGFLFLFLGIFALASLFLLWKKSLFLWHQNTVLFFVLGLWGLSYFLSQFFSIAPMESFWGSFERFSGTMTHIYYAIHFFLCLWIFRHARMQKIFFLVVFWVGVVAALYGLIQFFGEDPLRTPLPSFFGKRIFSTLGHPNFLGQFLIFPIIVNFYFIIEKFRERQFLKVSLFSLGFFLMATALLFTHNRASMLGLAASFIILFFIWIHRVFQKKFFVWMIVALFIIAAAIFVSSKLPSFDLRSVNARSILWKTAASAAQDHWFLGSGLETISHRLMPLLPAKLYHFESLNHIPDRTHNELLDILLTRGIFGVLLYIVNFIFLGWVLFRKKLESPAARISFFAILTYSISVQFGFSLSAHVVFLMAFWSILLIETLPWKTFSFVMPPLGKTMITVLILFFSFFSLRQAYYRVATDVLFQKAISAYFEDEYKGLPEFEKIIDHSPQYVYPYESLFTFYRDFAQTNPDVLGSLERYALQAERTFPKSFRAQFMNAEILFWKGNYDRAEARFREILAKASSWPMGWFLWGKNEFLAKRYVLAEVAFERLVEITPPIWKTPQEQEKYRIFRISNHFFFDALKMLHESYMKTGQARKAREIEAYF